MEKRFITPTIITCFLVVVALILSFMPLYGGISEKDIIPLLPGGTLSDVILTIVIPFTVMVIVLLLGSISAIILVKIHKLFKLKKYDYFIYMSEKKLSSGRILLRSFFGGLLAVNIAIYLSLIDSSSIRNQSLRALSCRLS